MSRPKYDWLEIAGRYFQGENIEKLSEEYGFNLKYWYRKYYKDWSTIKDGIKKEAVKTVYNTALKAEVDKREKIRENFSAFLTRLFMQTVANFEDKTKTTKQKFEDQKLLKITAETISTIKAQQFDVEYIKTKADGAGDPVPEDTDSEPELKGV